VETARPGSGTSTTWPRRCPTSPWSRPRWQSRLPGGRSILRVLPKPSTRRHRSRDREPLPDVIVLWVPSEIDKLALVQDARTPFFTTPHFDGHPPFWFGPAGSTSLTRQELREVIEDAWLSGPRRREQRAGSALTLLSTARRAGDPGVHAAKQSHPEPVPNQARPGQSGLSPPHNPAARIPVPSNVLYRGSVTMRRPRW